ncbi:flagellar motor switch protein FliM [Thermosipho melanesiensis]|uniref:Flagellar motor switch protein FliM n=2 Tax=Thermosipho melanesiensis TaxID=46541 RepID=A6LMJ6_THEM4|nr:flagellar motor switch protein FliM [Thermosipho melanesiensis]ABR31147.1 flagellar motor switch protein FliM [Thermosipho melanesiensis BI429]APT74237.1 flagellar motor switch protein FliM [Thermosipho melanesiensis]OOC36179.1 flagellar motor switch protein FliM [Thermosipho melanesiensis]OOC36997.1 flagellar motor switch protein FliM [Thermosipho melanesiensis]OOC37749.1 flagellar motor switch protein FliM [Thermosipho melanesiensis]
MSDVLSQEEIDRLLQAVNQGEVSIEQVKKEEEEKKVRTYDFLRPRKFSKEQERTLQMLHENFARTLSTYFSGRLRSFVAVNLVGIDQMTYDEFIKSIKNPSFITIFSAKEFVGSAVLDIDLAIFYGILEILLGGPGSMTEINRPPTETEIEVMRKEVVNILTNLSQAWTTVYSFVPVIEAIETNPQFVQVVALNEMVLVITFFVNIGNVEGYVNICWPSSLIEPIGEKLTTQSWFKTKQKVVSEEDMKALKENLARTIVELSATIGETNLTLWDILNLEVGDVIRLNTFKEDPLKIKLNGKDKFLGAPGVFKGKYAVKILEVFDEEEIK